MSSPHKEKMTESEGKVWACVKSKDVACYCPACSPEKEKREDAGEDRCGECGKEKCELNPFCIRCFEDGTESFCHGHPTPRPSQEAMEEAEKILRLYSNWNEVEIPGRRRDLQIDIALALDHAKAEEQIICAAIRAKNGKIYPCAYHAQGLQQQHYQRGFYKNDGYDEDEQGFITSRNRFVDRKEGLRIAIAAGQVLEKEKRHGKNELFSEDLPYNRFEELHSALSLARKEDDI